MSKTIKKERLIRMTNEKLYDFYDRLIYMRDNEMLSSELVDSYKWLMLTVEYQQKKIEELEQIALDEEGIAIAFEGYEGNYHVDDDEEQTEYRYKVEDKERFHKFIKAHLLDQKDSDTGMSWVGLMYDELFEYLIEEAYLFELVDEGVLVKSSI
ncbi:hypothetical protein [Chengkuizengella axinellae]|uniref:Uncharacterized protein n=1 Tax=Chengkuizengella axinellae TaxID=3064388 RepID=A0ABT9IYY4_9BACL|nr:hypothetical protein [Chengkuizengella sp. 2205SS18-9]MDP5274337.1 hypothetical protein [Chengkuizengella sp. 2205SS18-9]